MISLSVKNISYSYNSNPLLQNISLEVKTGDILCILGPNGSGKTTLLKCLLKFNKINDGEIRIEGKSIFDIKDKDFWKKVAYVPQSKRDVFGFTALEMVEMGRNNHLGMLAEPGKKDREIALAAMEKCGIMELKDKPCNQMSGGEFQLVMIARALASEPEILILDEPEANLDLKNQLVILEMLKNLSQKMLVIMTTHSVGNAIETGTKALLLKKNEQSLFGDGKKIITEKNIEKYFGIKSSVLNIQADGKNHSGIIPLSISNSKV